MKRFTEALYGQMMEALKQNSVESDSLLAKAERNYKVVHTTLTELQQFISDYSFEDKQEEIQFFKNVKPQFHKELFYWAEIAQIEANKPISGSKEHKHYTSMLLDAINHYLRRNRWLQTYYKLGNISQDETLFIREADYGPFLPDGHIDADNIFSTTASSTLARILAQEEVAQWLNSSKSDDEQEKGDQRPKLTWTGSKAQLIELVYALESYGIFNNGKTNVKEIMKYFQYCFNVDKVSNYYGYFQTMRIRKKDRTPFLNALVEHTIRRMDESDEFPRFS